MLSPSRIELLASAELAIEVLELELELASDAAAVNTRQGTKAIRRLAMVGIFCNEATLLTTFVSWFF